MKLLFSALVLSILFTSCFDHARVRIVKTNTVVTTDALSYDDLEKGDTVQLKKISMQDWEIDEQAAILEDTLYFIEYLRSSGDTAGFFVEKQIGVIEKIK